MAKIRSQTARILYLRVGREAEKSNNWAKRVEIARTLQTGTNLYREAYWSYRKIGCVAVIAYGLTSKLRDRLDVVTGHVSMARVSDVPVGQKCSVIPAQYRRALTSKRLAFACGVERGKEYNLGIRKD